MILKSKNNINVKKFIVGPLQTNCYVITLNGSKEAFVIDPGFPDKSILEYIRNNNLEVKCIVNTHGHADHIAGNAQLGYPVFIHEKDKDYLSNSMLNLSFLAGFAVEGSVADTLLQEGDTIMLGDVGFEVIHTPGHTPGGICLKGNTMLFSGDTLFFEGIGRSDCPGGDNAAILASIEKKLLILDDTLKVFPGHGPETSIGHERDCNPFL